MDELFYTLKISKTATQEEIRTAFREWKKNQQEVLKHGSRDEQSRAAANITRISDLYKKLMSNPESRVTFSQPKISLEKSINSVEEKIDLKKIESEVEKEVEAKIKSESESKIEESVENQTSTPIEKPKPIPTPVQTPKPIEPQPQTQPQTQFQPRSQSQQQYQNDSSNPYKIATFVLITVLVCAAGFFLYSKSQPESKEIVVVTQPNPNQSQNQDQSLQPNQNSIEKSPDQKIVETKPIDPNPGVTKDQRDAVQDLLDFHSNITQKNYQQAYECLSPEFQNSMDYDGWAKGFKTTVSSTVSNVKIVSESSESIVVTYDLEAIDNPNIRSKFHGTVTLKKTPSGWKIDEILNRVAQ